MKREEVLKILGKTKKGRLAIGLYNKGKLALGKLKDLASKFDVISDKGVKEGLKRQGKYIDKSGKVRPLATKGFHIKKPKGKNGSNGHPPTNKKSTSRTRTKKTLKPRTRGSDLNIFIGGAGTGMAATAGGLNVLNRKITKDAKKREAYAKAKTKSKKYKSKSHMYPPPKTKRPKSKGHMYPPPKRKKRSGV